MAFVKLRGDFKEGSMTHSAYWICLGPCSEFDTSSRPIMSMELKARNRTILSVDSIFDFFGVLGIVH